MMPTRAIIKVIGPDWEIFMDDIITYFSIFWTQFTVWQFFLAFIVTILLYNFILFIFFSYKDNRRSYNDLKGKFKRYTARSGAKEKR